MKNQSTFITPSDYPSDENRSQSIILVVDDDPALRRVLMLGIERAGYTCRTAASAREALAVLEEVPIEVVISDINMPEMDGLKLLQIVRERHRADMIVMTGFVEDYRYEDIVSLGASDFIQKPVSINEIIARLKRVLKERVTLAERNRAARELELNLEKLRQAMEGIIKAISLTVEMRDPYTAGHQQRVARLSCAIARELKLSHDTVYGLKMAGSIHDLGKITVPAEILSKPGQLSPIEYELIKGHAQAGYDMLKKIEFPWPLKEIIIQHHERIDGSGYPRGLKGDQILLEAKILAVADVFETISSHRPYRPSLGFNRAVEELTINRSILFDARVVDACLNVFEEGKFSFDTPDDSDEKVPASFQHWE